MIRNPTREGVTHLELKNKQSYPVNHRRASSHNLSHELSEFLSLGPCVPIPLLYIQESSWVWVFGLNSPAGWHWRAAFSFRHFATPALSPAMKSRRRCARWSKPLSAR